MILRKLKNYRAWCWNLDLKVNKIMERLGINDDERKYYVRSYAQHGEDTLIFNMLTKVLKISKPSYIDIGAHHPYEISNTAIFYEHGCRGVNIEANPVLFKRFPVERPEDINICCGLGSENAGGGYMPFYMIDDWSGRNSFDKSIIDKFLKDYPDFRIQKVIDVPMRTLTDVFEHELKRSMSDYMTIDIEGLEYEVLSSFDMKNKGPKAVTIEVNDKKIIPYMEKSGYFLYAKIFSNHTYIRNEYKDIVFK